MRKYMLAALCCIMSLFILTGCKSSVPENTVFSVDDLSGKRIGVQLGTTGDTLVSDYEEDGSGTVVERYNKGNDAILALKQGKIDAVVIDVQPAQSFVKTNSELMILNEEFVTEDYAMCISKNKPELKASINEALNVIKANGTLDKIIDNYIGEDYMDVLADGCWEKYFTEKPPVFTKEEKQKWLSEYAKDVTLGSDAFFPFDDNIERAYRSGVKYIAQPGGSIRDKDCIDACNRHNMVMSFTGIRLFHH